MITALPLIFSLFGCAPANPASQSAKPEGGVDGGGGDVLQSTSYQVEQAVSNTYQGVMGNVFYNLALSEVNDPYVKRIMEKMFNDQVGQIDWPRSQPIFQDLVASQFHLQKEGCLEQSGESHAMGVQHFQLKEVICVSTNVLQKLPPEDLQAQLIGLFSHEFAHHFGFTEFDAVKFQTYIVHHIDELYSFPNMVSVKIPDLILKFEGVANVFYNHQFTFQNGKQIDENAIDPKAVSCTLYIALGDGFYDFKSDKINSNISFALPAQSMHWMHTGDSGSSQDFQTEFSTMAMTGIEFHVNPSWNGHMYDVGGTEVTSVIGNKTVSSRITAASCRGSNIHLMDLKNVFPGEEK